MTIGINSRLSCLIFRIFCPTVGGYHRFGDVLITVHSDFGCLCIRTNWSHVVCKTWSEHDVLIANRFPGAAVHLHAMVGRPWFRREGRACWV